MAECEREKRVNSHEFPLVLRLGEGWEACQPGVVVSGEWDSAADSQSGLQGVNLLMSLRV
jgi:hypothetical protein